MVYGDGEQSRSFGNVYDVVDAIHRLSVTDEAVGELFNIGNDKEITIHGLAEMVKERAGSSSEIKVIPYEEAYKTPGFEDFRRRVPSLAKIGKAVGWEPSTSLQQTIDQIIEYYKERI